MMKKGMTKKIIAAALALTLSMSMGGLVYAEESNEVFPQVSPAPITATYQEGNVTTGLTYHVEVEWGSLEYTYHSGITKKWSPEKLKYVEEKGTASWTCEEGADQITVTNNSNADITATLTYEEKNSSKVSGDFTKSKLDLKSAESGTASSETATLSLQGTLSEKVTTKTEIGGVTVTISDYVGSNSDYCTNGTAGNEYSKNTLFRTTLTDNVYIAIINPTNDSYIYTSFFIQDYNHIDADHSWGVIAKLKETVTSAGTYSLKKTGSGGDLSLSNVSGKQIRLTLDMRDEDNPTLMVQII